MSNIADHVSCTSDSSKLTTRETVHNNKEADDLNVADSDNMVPSKCGAAHSTDQVNLDNSKTAPLSTGSQSANFSKYTDPVNSNNNPTSATLTTEQSDRLLEDIDVILAEEESSEASDEFFSDHVINIDHVADSGDEGEAGGANDKMETFNPYFLTNVSLDSSIAPDFVNLSEKTLADHDFSGSKEKTLADHDSSGSKETTFDPFLKLESRKVEKSSSHDSFVKIDN